MSDWFQRHRPVRVAGPRPARRAASPGLISFFSPCVIPLLPGYLSYATGISGG